jgi:hypothetical protein
MAVNRKTICHTVSLSKETDLLLQALMVRLNCGWSEAVEYAVRSCVTGNTPNLPNNLSCTSADNT